MSLKSSARIKKRRSDAAAAASSLSFGANNSSSFSTTTSNTTATTSNTISSTVPSMNSNSNCNSNSNNNNSSHHPLSGLSNATAKKHSFVGRNPNFDTDETKLLIQLWGDPKLQRTLITTHKKHAVICQLAAKMQEYGYHRSPEEITTRIKNLKCFYNRLKKDKECGGLGADAEPSWKHFAEMDAIMTRPIFSVRPNEVPAPSLKYQLEQALEEHAERRKRRLENGEELSESDNEEDDMLLSALVNKTKETTPRREEDAEQEQDVDINASGNGEGATSREEPPMGVKRRKLSLLATDVDMGEVLTCSPSIKTEPVLEIKPDAATAQVPAPATEPEVEDEDDDCLLLPLPKEEPIDVDAVDEGSLSSPAGAGAAPPAQSTSTMPTLVDMLQLQTKSPFTTANVIPASNITTTASSTLTTASTSASSVTAGKLQPGKISLVPTNFLMQPKMPGSAAAAGNSNPLINPAKAAAPQLQILQSAINQGARLMISGAAPTGGAQPGNPGLMATAPGGVKFVLVNADQAKAAAVGKSSASLPLATAQAAAAAAQVQQQHQQQQQQQQKQLQQQNLQKDQQQQQQQQQQQLQHQQLEKEEKRRAQDRVRDDQQSKRHMTTMRILLRQLLNAQNEANEIQHNRLSLERERLDWEKSMGDRLITLLPSLLQSGLSAAAAGNPGTTTAPTQPQFIVSGAGTGQRLQPPKLLFTTALPMTNGTTMAMPHILASNTLPKVIAASSSATTGAGTAKTLDNDVQLITPKLEKES